MVKTDMICIACPIGCSMEVEPVVNGTTTYKVTGYKCPRGKEYAIKEMTNPTRMVTSTVVIEGAHLPRLPVRTSQAIPKDKIFECMKVLDSLKVKAPIKAGDIIIENVCGSASNIVATRSM